MFESVRIVSSERKEKKNGVQENVLLLRKEGWVTKVRMRLRHRHSETF